MGTAGLRPAGDDYCSTRVEGWRDWQRVAAPGFLHSYTYWQDMARDRDGHFWGNMLMPVAAERCVPRRDHWLCVEQRLALGTPGGDDGELADGAAPAAAIDQAAGARGRRRVTIGLRDAGVHGRPGIGVTAHGRDGYVEALAHASARAQRQRQRQRCECST